MPRVACVMMQKDERTMLRPWLVWHGHLFGYQNLLVLDNGSTDPEVLATLREFAARGVFVDHGHATRDAYLAKGDILGALIREIDAVGQHDVNFHRDLTRCG